MEEILVKLDRSLRNIYSRYREQGRRDKGARYSLSLHYQDNLTEIEALGFQTSWSDIPGMATGILDLEDLSRVAAHPDVISLSYGEAPEPLLETSARDIRARATSSSNVGRDGLWFVDEATGNIQDTGGADGTGVIVGIIDTGIDITHPSFMASLSPYRTRILRIWDQGLAQFRVKPRPSTMPLKIVILNLKLNIFRMIRQCLTNRQYFLGMARLS